MKQILVVLFATVLLSACGESESGRLKNGDPAVAFQAEHLDGRMINFPDDFKGKAVALRFWADWCAFCRKEMTDLEAVYQEKREDGLVILAINVGQDRETVEKFINSLGTSYGAVMDKNSETAGKYGVIGLPTTFFFDRNGVLQGKILGESDVGVFRDFLAKTM